MKLPLKSRRTVRPFFPGCCGSVRGSRSIDDSLLAVGKLGIVIRTLNEAQHLPKLLQGIKQQSLTPDHILVVDSGSTDATADIARENGCTVISLEPSKFSYGRSLNLGFSACNTDIVVVVSAHVYPVHTDYLANLIAPFEDETVGMVYGRQVGDKSSQYSEKMLLEGWFPGVSEAWQRHPFANNANSAVRKDVWEQFRFSETLPALEDIHFANRMQEHGWFLSYQPDAEVVHVHNESWQAVKARYEREASALRQIFPSMRLGAPKIASLMVRNIIRDVVEAKKAKELSENLWKLFLFRYWQSVGFSSGFKKQPEQINQIMLRYFYSNNGKKDVTSDDTGERVPVDYSAID